MGFVVKRLLAFPFVAFQVIGRTTVSDLEWEHFNLINKKRAEGYTCPDGTIINPVPQPLVFECTLWKASYLHSQEMADHNFFNKRSLDGTEWFERADAAGLTGLSATSIVIGLGFSSAQGILDLWLSSDSHCKTIGDPFFRYFAVGHGFNPALFHKDYWTQMYGDVPPDAGVDTSCYPNATGVSEQTTITTQHTTTTAATTTIASTKSIGHNMSLDKMVSTSMAEPEPELSHDSATPTATTLRGSSTTTSVATEVTEPTSTATTAATISEVDQAAISGAGQLQGKLLQCLALIVTSSLLRTLW